MVSAATHSPFASHRRSPPPPAAASSHRDGQHGVWAEAAAQGASTAPPLRRWTGLLRSVWSACSLALARSLHAVDNDNSAPRPDASAASSTSAGAPLRRARRPRLTARTDGEFPHNLAGPEIAAGFELCQAARSHPIPGPLFWRHLSTRFFAYDTQKGLGPHRQAHVAIPAPPRAHLILIQPHLALGALDTFLDRPAHPGHLHLLSQARACQSKSNRRRQLTWIADTAPHEQPALPALLRCPSPE